MVLMWTDSDGVMHTVALPDPTDVMDEEFRSTLLTLAAGENDLADQLEGLEESLYEELPSRVESPSSDHVEAAPPHRLLRGRIESVHDLHACVRQLDPVWQLDAVLAIGDVLESLQGT